MPGQAWRALRSAAASLSGAVSALRGCALLPPLCSPPGALAGALRPACAQALRGAGRFGLPGGLPPPPPLARLLPPSAWRGFAAKANPALKVYKPTSPGQRHRVTTSRVGLHKGRPIKALTFVRPTRAARARARLTRCRGCARAAGATTTGASRLGTEARRLAFLPALSPSPGGGHKRLYRMVDFVRAAGAVRGVVQRLEYDPNRSARIALLDYALPPASPDAPRPPPKYAYILAPEGLKAGDSVGNGPGAGVFPGCAMALRDLPAGTVVHNVEMRPGGGGQLCRAAGTSAVLIKKGDDGYATVRLASGETRLLRAECTATVGVVGNKEHHNRKLGKAGASRHLGRRPSVRGVAMNPVDHPHGGGEGKTSGGRPSVTPWGWPTKGYRTRKARARGRLRGARAHARARAEQADGQVPRGTQAVSWGVGREGRAACWRYVGVCHTQAGRRKRGELLRARATSLGRLAARPLRPARGRLLGQVREAVQRSVGDV